MNKLHKLRWIKYIRFESISPILCANSFVKRKLKRNRKKREKREKSGSLAIRGERNGRVEAKKRRKFIKSSVKRRKNEKNSEKYGKRRGKTEKAMYNFEISHYGQQQRSSTYNRWPCTESTHRYKLFIDNLLHSYK